MTGTLGLFSLVDLIQLLSGAGRTGRLLIQHPRGDARIYFEEGQIVHAVFAGAQGEEAIYALFADERGPFSFTSGLPAHERSVELATQNLVLEAVRRLDEARREDDGAVPYESDMVPEPAATADPGRVTLGAAERCVFGQIDGRRSIERLAERCELSVDDASRIVGRLVGAELVVVRKRLPRTARLVVQPARGGVPHGTAGVDASIVQSWTRSLGRPPGHIECRRETGRVVRLRVAEQEAAGPYLLVGRLTLLRTGLRADEALLVRPFEGVE